MGQDAFLPRLFLLDLSHFAQLGRGWHPPSCFRLEVEGNNLDTQSFLTKAFSFFGARALKTVR